MQIAYSSFSTAVRQTTSEYLNLIDIKRNNRLLSKENQELKTLLIRYKELTLENERLRELVDFKKQTHMDLLAARVIGKDPVLDHVTILINRGTKHGLKAGMAVVTVNGAVGYVFRPEAFTAQVLVMTDRYAVIDAITQRSRARGIVEGAGVNAGTMRYLDRGADIKEGDLVVTSGLDNIFPKGFPIATVSKVSRDHYGTQQKVKLLPVINPSQLEDVFVILNAKNVDLTQKFALVDEPELNTHPEAKITDTNETTKSQPPKAAPTQPAPTTDESEATP